MKRVLVIDSEQTHRAQVRGQLEADGYSPVECDSGPDVIQHFNSGANAVILSQPAADLTPEFWQELRAMTPAPSIVIVPNAISGELDSATLTSLREGGVYVTAPAQKASTEYRLPDHGINFYDLERDILSQALAICHGNQTRAGTLLGLTRDQIRYRMAKFGMSSRDAARAGNQAA